ncbi:signal transduction histidine kinase [Streptomyces canus]|uniref:sensor histidine kinase n=1 Tax=Streptomyces sp. RP5T TaxID=2490848 RepID=UPI000F651065|nr:sensor histidine kinase [Streptomyces sp. RP5T]RRR78965.1 sensor histidine kinase [Streptomyces sp. RP5T]
MDHPTVRPPFGRRLTPAQLVALDCLAALAYVSFLLVLRHTPAMPDDGPTGWGADVLIAATGAPVAVRRLWPLPVFAVTVFTSLAAVALGVVTDPFLAVAFALYPVALTGRTPRRLPVAAAALIGLGGMIATEPRSPYTYWWLQGPGLIVLGWVSMAGSWALGTAVRERRAYAEHAARELAEHAVTEERMRIARELHDVVAHSIGIIAVKAAVANHVVGTRPEEAGDALRVIEATSRAALHEMRHLLDVLRSEHTGALTDADLSPVPGTAGLAGLVRSASDAGLRVSLEAPDLGDLPEALGLTVFRIVQEALTNAVKHAAPADCRVVITRDERHVTIDVTDDGGPARRGSTSQDGPGRGHGLIGMRERIAVYDGEFTAGPRPEGGFAVLARLPLDSAGLVRGAAR